MGAAAKALPRLLAAALAAVLAGCGGGSPATVATPPVPPPVPSACDPQPSASLVVNVQAPPYSAKGDGQTDDTAALQKALDAVRGTGGTVSIPAGTYMVDPVVSLFVGSRTTLKLDTGAVLKVIPTTGGNYEILTVYHASEVNILGGTLQGDYGTPVTHQGSSGEWGFGVAITGSSSVIVAGVKAMDFWGDGFAIGGGSSGVLLCSVQALHNRRNAISVTNCNGLVIRDSTFSGTHGVAPEAGLDIEPNPGETVSNVQVLNCVFADNYGYGLADGVNDSDTGKAFVTAVTLDGNRVSGNGIQPASGEVSGGIRFSNAAGHTITHNTLQGNIGHGIYVRNNANDSTISGNTVSLTAGDGIVLDWTSGNSVTGNTVTGNTGHGILTINSPVATITGNTVSGNGLTP